MKIFAILALCIVCAVAKPHAYSYDAPPHRPDYSYSARPEIKVVELKKEIVPILKQEMLDDNKGTYKLEVQSGDGQSQFESGKLKDLGNPEGLDVVKEGRYSFTSPEGKVFTVNWKSDENGFQAFGEHLPTAPPMSEEIRKSLLIPRIPEYQEKEFKVVVAKSEGHAHHAYDYGYSRF